MLPYIFFVAMIVASSNFAQPNPNFKLQETPPPEVMQVVKKEFPRYWNSFNTKQPEPWGFSPGDSLLTATLGKPFKIFQFLNTTATPEARKKNNIRLHVIPLKSSWYVPLMYNNEMKDFFLVSQNRETKEWEVVDFDYQGCAAEYTKIKIVWPEEKGFHPVLVMAGYPNTKWFFWVPEVNTSNVTPLITRPIKQSYPYNIDENNGNKDFSQKSTTSNLAPNSSISNQVNIGAIKDTDYVKLDSLKKYYDVFN